MRIAYLDCFSGMSGDMFLGALVDAGVSPRLLEETVAALNVEARLEISRVIRSGISATKVDVYAHGEKELPREVYWEQQSHRHEGSHAQEHPHDHSHEHSHVHGHQPVELREHNYGVAAATEPRAAERVTHEHRHGRGLSEIREIIN